MKRRWVGEMSEDEEEFEEIMLLKYIRNKNKDKLCRGPTLFRKRRDSKCLTDLAINEKSFVAEYRLDVEGGLKF